MTKFAKIIRNTVLLGAFASAVIFACTMSSGSGDVSNFDNTAGGDWKETEAATGNTNNNARAITNSPTPTNTPTPTPIPELVKIRAVYLGSYVVVGDEVDPQDIRVTAIYDKGPSQQVTGFDIIDPCVYDVGRNEIVVNYEGFESTVYVTGREPLEIVKITATYKGSSVIVTNKVNKSDIEVYAVYNWKEEKPTKITNFTLEPDTVEAVGINTLYVSYGDLEAVPIKVTGIQRTITDVSVKYKGDPVYVGNSVNPDDIEVIVTYNDKTSEQVDNFRLTGDIINSLGKNMVTVTYRSYIKRIVVDGIEPVESIADRFKRIDFETGASTMVTLLVSHEERAQYIGVFYVEWDEIENAVHSVINTDNYLGFEVFFDDPDCITEFPMYCRVTRPDEFDPDRFGIYYSPDKKTIMAKVVGEYIDVEKKQFVFLMYEPGVYILIDEQPSSAISSINIAETEVKLKVNRNYSINAVVLPAAVENPEIIYWSTDDSIATVSDKGKVKTLSPGECDIIVEAADGSGVQNQVHITVTEK